MSVQAELPLPAACPKSCGYMVATLPCQSILGCGLATRPHGGDLLIQFGFFVMGVRGSDSNFCLFSPRLKSLFDGQGGWLITVLLGTLRLAEESHKQPSWPLPGPTCSLHPGLVSAQTLVLAGTSPEFFVLHWQGFCCRGGLGAGRLRARADGGFESCSE